MAAITNYRNSGGHKSDMQVSAGLSPSGGSEGGLVKDATKKQKDTPRLWMHGGLSERGIQWNMGT